MCHVIRILGTRLFVAQTSVFEVCATGVRPRRYLLIKRYTGVIVATDAGNINFGDRNTVEKFLESSRFRPCAHLKCSPLSLPHQVVYMPMCMEGRFHKEGIAEFFDMPVPSRPLSPVVYTTIPIWAPFVSCPLDCKGYQNRTVARLQAAAVSAARWLFGKRSTDGLAVQEKKWWERPVGIIAIEIVATVVGGVVVGLILWALIGH